MTYQIFDNQYDEVIKECKTMREAIRELAKATGSSVIKDDPRVSQKWLLVRHNYTKTFSTRQEAIDYIYYETSIEIRKVDYSWTY